MQTIKIKRSALGLLTIICLVITSNSAIAQSKGFAFTPKWKVGEKKTVTIAQHETEYKKGKLVEDTTRYLGAALNVLEESPDDYTLEILYENVALRVAIDFFERIADELKGYKNLQLKYRVNKKTGKTELINWKEAQTFINKSFDQINVLLEKKVPDVAEYAKLAFTPITEMFESKENIEAYVNSEIGFLIFPYGKKFVTGDTLRITQACTNPFSPTETIDQTTLSYLSNINESKGQCDINSSEIYDLGTFKEMMKSMMVKMSKTFGASESDRDKAAKEIDSIDFDVSNETTITFDYNSSWPVKVMRTGKVVAADPRGRSEKVVVTTVTLK